jgi:hypothetical protein
VYWYVDMDRAHRHRRDDDPVEVCVEEGGVGPAGRRPSVDLG